MGHAVLGQCAEALRRVRNSARFILGNLGPGLKKTEKVSRSEMGLVSSLILDNGCWWHAANRQRNMWCTSYTNWRQWPERGTRPITFWKVCRALWMLFKSFIAHLTVVNALTNFANITLSSFYFDITKDCLYANSNENLGRRAVVTVLEQVCPSASVQLS
jgi:isoleucyl-tRNA synthetase